MSRPPPYPPTGFTSTKAQILTPACARYGVSGCMYAYVSVSVYVCIYIYMYMYLYIYIYICTYVYMSRPPHTHTCWLY